MNGWLNEWRNKKYELLSELDIENKRVNECTVKGRLKWVVTILYGTFLGFNSYISSFSIQKCVQSWFCIYSF